MFSYYEDSEACPSFPSISFSSPQADLTLACPDWLESVPGKNQSPESSNSSYPTSISPFAQLPWGKPPPPSGTMSKNRRNHRGCSTEFCPDETVHKTMPPLLSQSFVWNNFFSVDLQKHCSKMNPCMHLTVQTFVCPTALTAWRQ